MFDQIFYKLDDAARLLACSRDMVSRYVNAGMLVVQGEHVGRRVTGASLRALNKRIEEGEDVCATLKAIENGALSEPKPTAKVRSIKTSEASGGTSPRQKTDAASLASEPLASRPPAWLKKIT